MTLDLQGCSDKNERQQHQLKGSRRWKHIQFKSLQKVLTMFKRSISVLETPSDLYRFTTSSNCKQFSNHNKYENLTHFCDFHLMSGYYVNTYFVYLFTWTQCSTEPAKRKHTAREWKKLKFINEKSFDCKTKWKLWIVCVMWMKQKQSSLNGD